LGIVGTFIMKELPVSIKPGRSKGTSFATNSKESQFIAGRPLCRLFKLNIS